MNRGGLWLQLSAGRGPAECQRVVARLMPILCAEAADLGLRTELLEATAGAAPDTLASALLAVEPKVYASDPEALAAGWVGTVQWVGKSPFRPHHKRQNWFIGIEQFALPERPSFNDQDIEISVLCASGPGGQHVNKTQSAVRVVHRPTGLSTVARQERSQHQNRRLALARLQALLQARAAGADLDAEHARWQEHNALIRGNAVRVYYGEDYVRRL
ncbi:MAG TPA: peptide chain release factor H [Pseudomonadota bacterium]|nr:peptide chain release factor H [Pseudomonadota bacterium]